MSGSHQFLPSKLWLINQRCCANQPLFKDCVDRRRWLYWLYQARRRFGLSVLNFVVLPSETQLLLLDKGRGEIPCSMQLVARSMAADYNRFKRRQGPFWEGRYSASRMDAGASLPELLVTMDLTPVKRGCVNHPEKWQTSGFYELQNPPPRARRIDVNALQRLLNPVDLNQLLRQRKGWVQSALNHRRMKQSSRAADKSISLMDESLPLTGANTYQ